MDDDCKLAKVWISKRPALLRIQSFERAEEVSLRNEHGWQVIGDVEPGEPEDASDLRG